MPYRDPGWLLDTAGIVSVPVSPRVDVATRPLDEEVVALFRELQEDDIIVRVVHADGSESHKLTTWPRLATPGNNQ